MTFHFMNQHAIFMKKQLNMSIHCKKLRLVCTSRQAFYTFNSISIHAFYTFNSISVHVYSEGQRHSKCYCRPFTFRSFIFNVSSKQPFSKDLCFTAFSQNLNLQTKFGIQHSECQTPKDLNNKRVVKSKLGIHFSSIHRSLFYQCLDSKTSKSVEVAFQVFEA